MLAGQPCHFHLSVDFFDVGVSPRRHYSIEHLNPKGNLAIRCKIKMAQCQAIGLPVNLQDIVDKGSALTSKE